MQIKIVAVGDAELKTGKNGKPYSAFELTFKNLDKNTTQSKKIMSFDKKLYELFQASHSGDIYNITSVKEGEFINWKDATKGTEGANVPAVTGEVTGTPRSAYKNFNDDSRQLTIIRQSTLKMAIDWVTATGGDPNLGNVWDTAKLFQDYVLNPEFKVDSVTEEADAQHNEVQ